LTSNVAVAGVGGADVVALLKSKCSDCHLGAQSEGEFDLTSLDSADSPNDRRRQWSRVFKVLATKQMPPGDAESLSRADRTKVVSWIKLQFPDATAISDWEQKIRHPEYGNYLDHASLFDGSVQDAPYSPARLWKKSSYIFDSLADRGIGFRSGRGRSPHLSSVKQPFTMEEKAGVRDYAAVMFADSATLGTMLRNAEAIVDQHLAGAMQELSDKINGPTPVDQLPKDKNGKPIRPRHSQTPEEFGAIILSDTDPSTEQIHAAIERMFQLVIERSATKDEKVKYEKLMKECAQRGGKVEGLRMMLAAIAVSPAAIYRSELGHGSADEHGRKMLSPADLAFAIAYALTDQKPDQQLLEAAQAGRLASRKDVAREVVRIWEDQEIDKPRILRFFHEFFGYDAAPGVFKDTARFGEYRQVPERLVADADTLVMHFVHRDMNVLAELLTTDQYFVAHTGDNTVERETHDALQAFYDYYKDKPWREFPYAVPKEHMTHVRSIHRMFTHANGNVTKRWMNYLERCDKNGLTHIPMMSGREYIAAYSLDENKFDYPVEQPFSLAPDQRRGILMHPAWLIAHSLNLDNDPVRRGKWIRERLLADTVPELPITVDAQIPEAPDQTLRQRFAVTREETCWRCHVKMNPLGMPFERFDDFGRHRTVERLHAQGKTSPVDATGVLVGTGSKTLDGDVDDPLELVQRLAKSERVRQSFVRHAFRYWMGRNEILSDSKTLIAADNAYVQQGGSFKAMVISLLTSDSFLYRK